MTATAMTNLIFGLLLLLWSCAGSAEARSNTAIANGGASQNLLETALLKFSKMNEINAAAAAGGAGAQVPCTCGVFLSGQFEKGSAQPPRGNPALLYEQDVMLACNQQGVKQCTNRCLEMIVKHLPNSPNIICGTIDRDCHRERAYLFIQNCNSTWVNTRLSAGREYCCKSGTSVPCPLTL